MLLTHHSEFGVKDGTHQVLQPCGSDILPVGMHIPDTLLEGSTTLQTCVDEFMNPACMFDIVALYKQAYLRVAPDHQTCLI